MSNKKLSKLEQDYLDLKQRAAMDQLVISLLMRMFPKEGLIESSDDQKVRFIIGAHLIVRGYMAYLITRGEVFLKNQSSIMDKVAKNFFQGLIDQGDDEDDIEDAFLEKFSGVDKHKLRSIMMDFVKNA